MHELLLAFAKWLEVTPWGSGIRDSLWAYPFTQLIHFTGLSIWVGTNFALDLSLLGIGKQRATAAEIAHDLFAWNWTGAGIVLMGGFLLFSANAGAYVQNPAFQWKLTFLVPLALIWHIVVQRKAYTWGLTMETPVIAKLAGLAEMLLWTAVITAAVLIPNY